MTNSKKDSELEKLAMLFANRIGSPWGEGATYTHSQAEPGDDGDKPKENGRLYSHLNDKDFELFVTDFVQAINSKYITKEESDRRVLEAEGWYLNRLIGIGHGHDTLDDVKNKSYSRIAELRELLKGDGNGR